MRELGALTRKSKGAIYQWKRASSFPFRIYKNRDGLDCVSRRAVLAWMKENGMVVRKKSKKKTSGKKRVSAAARRAVVRSENKSSARSSRRSTEEEYEEEEAVQPTVVLPLTEDFTVQFWSRVVDAMQVQGQGLNLSYENGTAVLTQM
jgi:hypothetical protein